MLFLVVALLTAMPAASQTPPQYLFSYFAGNGEDGLHLAASQDGLHGTAFPVPADPRPAQAAVTNATMTVGEEIE